MSEPTHAHGAGNGLGYETTDVHTGPIYRFIAVLIALMFSGIIIAYFIFLGLNALQTEDYAKLNSTSMQKKAQIPAGPLLQVTNHADLLSFREQEAREVSGHATWRDKNAKVVRLPIDRAIEIVAEHGLPAFKNEATPAQAQGAAK